MTVGTQEEAKAVMAQAVSDAVERYGNQREELIPILNDVNRTLGYLPAEALEEISQRLRVPKSQLFSVASFYQMLSTKQRGTHVIKFCESAPCHVVGGRQVWQALQSELQLKAGETSPDGKWTLETVSCLGVCAVGPVIVIDDDIYGNVEPKQIAEILARY
jgi:NADH:ubiquinone oxidoreductase subunit E